MPHRRRSKYFSQVIEYVVENFHTPTRGLSEDRLFFPPYTLYYTVFGLPSVWL